MVTQTASGGAVPTQDQKVKERFFRYFQEEVTGLENPHIDHAVD